MDKKSETFSGLAMASAVILLASNILAVKIWSFFGIPVDGGILLYPLSYIVGDLLAELYGARRANWVVKMSFIFNLIFVLVVFVAILLPAYTEWQNQAAFETILGFTPRVIAGSLIAYLVSGFFNNFVFAKIRQRQDKATRGKFKSFFVRALGSSLVAHLADTLIFETIAFFGVLPFKDFIYQASFAFIAGVVIEALLCPLTALVARKMRQNA